MSARATAGASAGSRRAHGAYHHGDLRRALVEVALQLIDEGGPRGFSLAEASRRLGVAASAPYAHFADRDDLLAAVALHGLRSFEAQLARRLRREPTPERRLTAISRAYVRFAGTHEALFRTLFEAQLDKTRHGELAEAEARIDEAFRGAVGEAVEPAGEASIEALAAAIEAVAHGHATLLLDGRFGSGRAAIAKASDSAARATAALVEGRGRLLG